MRESSIVMLLVLAIATCTARPHVALQVPVAGSLSSPREGVMGLRRAAYGVQLSWAYAPGELPGNFAEQQLLV